MLLVDSLEQSLPVVCAIKITGNRKQIKVKMLLICCFITTVMNVPIQYIHCKIKQQQQQHTLPDKQHLVIKNKSLSQCSTEEV